MMTVVLCISMLEGQEIRGSVVAVNNITVDKQLLAVEFLAFPQSDNKVSAD